MTTHILKCWTEPFNAVVEGRKTFEIRDGSDRNYAIGDRLQLRDYDPEAGTFSGREALCDVPHLIRGPAWGLPKEMVVMSIKKIGYWPTARVEGSQEPSE